MRFLIPLVLLFSAPLAARSEEHIVSFDELISKMSDGGKRSFLYQEGTSARFAERRVHGGSAALDGPKAYEAGLEILKTGGFAAVPLAGGAVRIVLAELAGREALRVVASAEELPAAEEFCSLAIVLHHARVRDMLALLQALLSDPRNVVCAESTNSMIVSDYASNLRKLADLIRRMDVGQDVSTWRISVVVLEGSDATAASVPAGFEGVKLEAATGRKAFKVLGDGMTTLLMGGNPLDRSPLACSTLRIWGGEKLGVEIKTSLSAEGAVTLEQLRVTAEVEAGKEAPTLLQTRMGLKDATWATAGSLPGSGKDSPVRVVLVKAELVK